LSIKNSLYEQGGWAIERAAAARRVYLRLCSCVASVGVGKVGRGGAGGDKTVSGGGVGDVKAGWGEGQGGGALGEGVRRHLTRLLGRAAAAGTLLLLLYCSQA